MKLNKSFTVTLCLTVSMLILSNVSAHSLEELEVTERRMMGLHVEHPDNSMLVVMFNSDGDTITKGVAWSTMPISICDFLALINELKNEISTSDNDGNPITITVRGPKKEGYHHSLIFLKGNGEVRTTISLEKTIRHTKKRDDMKCSR